MTQVEVSQYDQARKRAEKKRKFRGDVVVYAVINSFLVIIWALSGFGYFWPAWVMAGWGVFVALAGWDIYFRREITEEDIQKEMGKYR
ncbi:hypothetical protein GCM10009841_05470 [Microlunatus panaciterrae]|uniref:Ion transporter superfamily protein YfcC n=1 Tax=Microlunatus panaciterrae TaxID=400768 RepID=A0ABS2RJF4_9ACTN|nr:2TM domain-containing protein [Microlunatus panaciterrae]MBM7798798.1 putative ion transporter superfamily protein YfcC [Microlunatus panaciterrae]